MVEVESNGNYWHRTLSKKLLQEFVDYLIEHPEANAATLRNMLSGTSDIDKFEYGYYSTFLPLSDAK